MSGALWSTQASEIRFWLPIQPTVNASMQIRQPTTTIGTDTRDTKAKSKGLPPESTESKGSPESLVQWLRCIPKSRLAHRS